MIIKKRHKNVANARITAKFCCSSVTQAILFIFGVWANESRTQTAVTEKTEKKLCQRKGGEQE